MGEDDYKRGHEFGMQDHNDLADVMNEISLVGPVGSEDFNKGYYDGRGLRDKIRKEAKREAAKISSDQSSGGYNANGNGGDYISGAELACRIGLLCICLGLVWLVLFIIFGGFYFPFVGMPIGVGSIFLFFYKVAVKWGYKKAFVSSIILFYVIVILIMGILYIFGLV